MKNSCFLIFILLFTIGCSSSKSVIKNGFHKDEVQIIMNADSLKPMRVFKITNKKDSHLLRTKSTYIKPNPNNPILQNFVKKNFV